MSQKEIELLLDLFFSSLFSDYLWAQSQPVSMYEGGFIHIMSFLFLLFMLLLHGYVNLLYAYCLHILLILHCDIDLLIHIPYFFGYKTEFFPSKKIQNI